ncbi:MULTISPECIES: relaxase/mobilization nuclease domain-containing protein [Vibrio]|jgi:type IV secretory pathway VirD2 relaxase|uniref:Type IV secretion system protein VirD2 n=1 Tax=Vibrio alginolyticus TaxID=663 RepID=A0A2K9UZ59_VIBAL|nr:MULTISPECIES: relaxase/mobilization nuclease domain-containing protein [Vibrio]HCE3569194.1 relaxase/mobilization nuclease domain-containing protein [Vibrio parahaemolyticus]AUV50313.1 type IV secretion system protein VirD2 [Vibrio alginolyticus]MDW3058864.1 relaxase/mobilization nuclease domain-containing protein [Vibrio sp. 1978]RCR64734.1 type IV secretion system protein VirD2 [Vibrio harveyi]RCR64802.1 type IV secretion system protein VirD2 [Vibrio harveyi]
MGSLANDTISDLLDGDVKTKANKTGNLSRAKRIADRAPEVMVKISGNTKGAGHVQAHLDYISRNGKLEIEDERGETLKGKTAVRALAKDWSQDQGKRRKNTRETTNIVLSMPDGTEPKAVKNAARAFAKNQFGKNHQYVMALHTDTDSPHVHLTVKNLGYDGRRLHVKKGDPQIWRESFAAELERLGVEAEATPRATRGVIKKGISQAIKHMRDKGMTPAVDQAKIREIIEDFSAERAGKEPRPRPWEDKIKDRQTYVRKAWLTAAKDLNQSDSAEDRELGQSIATFVKDMPPMKTERHELQEKVAAQLQQRGSGQRGGEKGRGQDQEQEDER